MQGLRGAGLAGLALLLGGCVAVGGLVPVPIFGSTASDAPAPAAPGPAPVE